MARMDLSCMFCGDIEPVEKDVKAVVCGRCSIYLSSMTVEQAKNLYHKAVDRGRNEVADFLKSQMPKKGFCKS